jgi:hypothetical protein
MRERREFNWKVTKLEEEFDQELGIQRHTKQLHLSDLNSFLHQRVKFLLSIMNGREEKKPRLAAQVRPVVLEFDAVFALEKFFNPHQIGQIQEATEKVLHRHGHLLSDDDFSSLYSLEFTTSPQKITQFIALYESGRLCNVLSQTSLNAIDRIIQSSLDFYRLRKSLYLAECQTPSIVVSDLPLHRLLALASVLGLGQTFPNANNFVSTLAFGREYTLLACTTSYGQYG